MSFRRLAWVVAASVALILSAGEALGALGAAEIEAAVEETLRQRHPTDTGDWWRALGPGAPRVIIAMHGRAKQTYRRVRLVEGLAWFPDVPEAVEFLRDQAQSSSHKTVRQSAIRSYGISQGAQAVELISKFLADEDPQIRLVAAQTLRRLPDGAGKQALESYLPTEKAPWIVSRLRREEAPAAAPSPAAKAPGERLGGEADLSGTWRGTWLSPRPRDPGMSAEAATLRLMRAGVDAPYTGECTVYARKPEKGKGSAIRWAFDEGVLSGRKVQGRIRRDPAEPGAEPDRWEAELWGPGTGGLQIHVRIEQAGAVFVGRRSE